MQHLRKLNNFNSYLAILSALDSAPIRRLEWQKQTSEVRGGASGVEGWVLCTGTAHPACLRQLVLRLTQPQLIPSFSACFSGGLRGLLGVSHSLNWRSFLGRKFPEEGMGHQPGDSTLSKDREWESPDHEGP